MIWEGNNRRTTLSTSLYKRMLSPTESLDKRVLSEENIEVTVRVVVGAYTSTRSMIVGSRSMICVNAVIRVICDACLAQNEVVREQSASHACCDKRSM